MKTTNFSSSKLFSHKENRVCVYIYTQSTSPAEKSSSKKKEVSNINRDNKEIEKLHQQQKRKKLFSL